MLSIIILIIFLTLAAFFKARLDFHSENTKHLTWQNKYKYTKNNLNENYIFEKTTKQDKLRYLYLYTPIYSEKFAYSTTFLVAKTDLWHLYQFFFLRSIWTCITVFMPLSGWWKLGFIFIIFPIFFGIIFEIFYKTKK